MIWSSLDTFGRVQTELVQEEFHYFFFPFSFPIPAWTEKDVLFSWELKTGLLTELV